MHGWILLIIRLLCKPLAETLQGITEYPQYTLKCGQFNQSDAGLGYTACTPKWLQF